jgi:methionyl-tRNA formyltransferase
MYRIVIFTQDTMASTVATRQIILKNHKNIIAIVLASQLKGGSFIDQVKLALKMIRKSSWSFALYKMIESSGYNLLLFLHKLIKSKRYVASTATSVADLARRYNIRLIKTGDISDQSFLRIIDDLKPDYIFSMMNQILKKNVFETLGNKLLNAHGSYLPEYRGAAQYFWYLLDGHTHFGVTLHYMNAGLDTGNIIIQQKFPFDRSVSAYRLHYLLGIHFGQMFNTFLERYGEGGVVPETEQKDEQATFTHMPTSEDVKKFHSAGHRFFAISDFLSCT